MKNERTVGIMLAIANAVLAIVSVVLYIGTDRTEPRFEFMEANIIYEEGMEDSRLLEGISAYDNEDGDLTGKIVVEKRIENQEQNLAVVFYAVSDKAGNVAKCSREFTAIYQTETGEANSIEAQDSPLVQSGVWSVLEGKGAEEKDPADTLEEDGSQGLEDRQQEEDEGEDSGEAEGEENGDAIEEGEETEEGEPDGEGENGHGQRSQEQETGQEQRSQEQGAGQEQQSQGHDAPTGRNAADSGAPVLELRVSEVTTQAGVAPAWVNVIGTLSDDKDGYETLFNNLEVSKYNINQAGTYQVNVSTKDSDGNKSRTVPLTIIVR